MWGAQGGAKETPPNVSTSFLAQTHCLNQSVNYTASCMHSKSIRNTRRPARRNSSKETTSGFCRPSGTSRPGGLSLGHTPTQRQIRSGATPLSKCLYPRQNCLVSEAPSIPIPSVALLKNQERSHPSKSDEHLIASCSVDRVRIRQRMIQWR